TSKRGNAKNPKKRTLTATKETPVNPAVLLNCRNGWLHIVAEMIPVDSTRIADTIRSATATGRHLLDGTVPVGNRRSSRSSSAIGTGQTVLEIEATTRPAGSDPGAETSARTP